MNREIKFRAWDSIREEMYFGYDVYNPVPTGYTQLEVMQFTGLKDKNGKEIYEGDIVKPLSITGKNMVVLFNEGMFNIAAMMKFNYGFEVIGNKYENPELL